MNNVAFERRAVRILSFDAYFSLKFLQKMYFGVFNAWKQLQVSGWVPRQRLLYYFGLPQVLV